MASSFGLNNHTISKRDSPCPGLKSNLFEVKEADSKEAAIFLVSADFPITPN